MKERAPRAYLELRPGNAEIDALRCAAWKKKERKEGKRPLQRENEIDRTLLADEMNPFDCPAPHLIVEVNRMTKFNPQGVDANGKYRVVRHGANDEGYATLEIFASNEGNHVRPADFERGVQMWAKAYILDRVELANGDDRGVYRALEMHLTEKEMHILRILEKAARTRRCGRRRIRTIHGCRCGLFPDK